jgi:hypothetical protein
VQRAPDIYLKELQDMISMNCGVDVSISTLWRTLRRAGFTMKKVRSPSPHFTSAYLLVKTYRLRSELLSNQLTSDSNISQESANIPLLSLFLWMKALWIAVHHIVAGLGLFEEQRPNERPFLSGEEGMYGNCFIHVLSYHTIYQILGAASYLTHQWHSSL